MKWRVYEAADKDARPLFSCQTGKKLDHVAVYPLEIQVILRDTMATVEHGGDAEEALYELVEVPGDSAFRMRLFTKAEYTEHWEEKLSTKVFSDNGEVVGAQWNNNFAGEPPGSWDVDAMYRSNYRQV